MDNSSRQSGLLTSNYQLLVVEVEVFVAPHFDRSIVHFKRIEIGDFVIAQAQEFLRVAFP